MFVKDVYLMERCIFKRLLLFRFIMKINT